MFHFASLQLLWKVFLVSWSKQSRPSNETDKFARKYKEENLCYIFSLPFLSGLLSLSLKCRPRSSHSRAGLNGSHMIFRKKTRWWGMIYYIGKALASIILVKYALQITFRKYVLCFNYICLGTCVSNCKITCES